MNSNTIIDALQLAGVASDQPLVLTNPGGNNPWLFSAPAGLAANAGAPVALSVPVVAGESAIKGLLNGAPLPGKQEWYADGRSFLVRAIGTIQPAGGSKTIKFYLFVGNGLGSGVTGSQADVMLGETSSTLPAFTTGGAYSNYYLEAKCLWDSASLQLNGVLSGMVGGVAIAASAFSVPNPTAWVAQQAAGSYNPLSFVLGVNIGSSLGSANDVVQLVEFTAELL